MISGSTRARRSLGLYVNGLGEDDGLFATPTIERVLGVKVNTAEGSGASISVAPSNLIAVIVFGGLGAVVAHGQRNGGSVMMGAIKGALLGMVGASALRAAGKYGY